MTLLVVDIGNTTTKVGAWEAGAVRAVSVSPTREVATLIAGVSQLMAAADVAGASDFQVALCSVVPAAERAWLEWAEQEGRGVFVVRGDTPTPLVNRYRVPARLGGDRLGAAVGAFRRFGAPAIVASLGTVVVVDAVSPAREFLGGAIWVGMATGFATLAERTAALPQVSAEAPSTPIGADTESCIHVGASYGTAALVEGLAARMREVVGEGAPLAVTGGDAELISFYLKAEHQVVPALTLEGIGSVWEHNHRKADEDR